tara:strand:+ start:179 stop:463 length:285 start_codon:yes stop_codon:yes gene_type:complete
MLSGILEGLEKLEGVERDREILRIGMVAELDAVSIYEQMALMTSNEDIKKVLKDVSKEEKTHVGEFESLLKKIDKEYNEELDAGKKEVEELTEN